MSVEDAARWATWLPPDAVTWVAIREAKERADERRQSAASDKTKRALRMMRQRRAREVAAMEGVSDVDR